jgi:hypothetical protein
MPDLTVQDVKCINEQRLCPGCLQGSLEEGPEGGAVTNTRCVNCGRRFDLVLRGSEVIGDTMRVGA